MSRLLPRTVVRWSTGFLVGLCCVVSGGDVYAEPVPGPVADTGGNPTDLGSLFPGVPEIGGGTNSRAGINTYEGDSSFVKDIMLGQVQRTASQVGAYGTDNVVTDRLSLPPLPGEQSMTDSSENPASFSPGGSVLKTSREKIQDFQIRMPTLIGMRQMTNAEPMKNMLLDLSTKKVPVLFQTMMMVENGAATGYIAALNATNGIMQNTMQTHDLQMKFLDLTDRTKVQKEAYLNRVEKALEESDDAWPAALFGALGDSAEGKISDFNSMPKPIAFSIANLRGAGAAAQGTSKSVKLSELLFFPDDASKQGARAIQNLQALQKDFIKYLGDYTIIEEPVAGKTTAVTIKLVRQMPETSPANQRRGLARAKWEEHGVVFEGLGKVLKAYCEFKQKNENASLQMFEGKRTAALALQEVMRNSTLSPSLGYMGMKHSPWEYASAPDIPLSFNLVEQLYLLSTTTTAHATQLDCGSFDLKASDITIMMGAATSSGKANLDDCSNNQGCVRNRVLVFVSDVVARSRALHLYRGLIDQSFKFAATPELSSYLTRMIKEEFGDFDINQEIARNRESWQAYQQFLGKVMQNQVGTTSPNRPNTSNNSPQEFAAGR